MGKLNFLLIGGAGFIGSHLVRHLMARGIKGITVMEPDGADVSRLDGCRARVVRGSLQDTELIDSIMYAEHITHVVHLVSAMTPGSGYHDYLKELSCVVRPTIRLIELCCRRDVKLVFFSSCAVYGESADGQPSREDSPLSPISYYGLSKLLIEANIRFDHRVDGLRYLILRPSNPYGPGQSPDKQQGIVAVAMSRIRDRQPLTVWGDGSAVRDYIYIGDMADAAVSVILGAENEAVNIGSGEGLSVNDMLDYAADVAKQHIDIEYVKTRSGDVRRIVLDTARMRHFYGKPLTPVRKGIASLRQE